ncbi:hypothetical protein B0H19DRAFT_1252871 [Mycena capillaripes]|nr:hypothetical protein B0H19DRAFT_1252871 [Mycena capillaripes]
MEEVLVHDQALDASSMSTASRLPDSTLLDTPLAPQCTAARNTEANTLPLHTTSFEGKVPPPQISADTSVANGSNVSANPSVPNDSSGECWTVSELGAKHPLYLKRRMSATNKGLAWLKPDKRRDQSSDHVKHLLLAVLDPAKRKRDESDSDSEEDLRPKMRHKIEAFTDIPETLKDFLRDAQLMMPTVERIVSEEHKRLGEAVQQVKDLRVEIEQLESVLAAKNAMVHDLQILLEDRLKLKHVVGIEILLLQDELLKARKQLDISQAKTLQAKNTNVELKNIFAFVFTNLESAKGPGVMARLDQA